jgi:ethanolamine utilization protein EutN
MILAKVVSRVVASARLESLPQRQLLSVVPLKGFGDPVELIAIDSVSAGPGDTVLVLQEGTGARQATLEDPSQPLPAQIVIVGVVDEIHYATF